MFAPPRTVQATSLRPSINRAIATTQLCFALFNFTPEPLPTLSPQQRQPATSLTSSLKAGGFRVSSKLARS
jgi:hypothetical protein